MRPPVAPTGWPREIPEPLTLTRSKAVVEVPFAQHRQHLGGERLVELDQAEVAEAEAGALERRGGGRDRPDPHRLRRHSRHRPGDEPAQRAQAELGGALGVGDDAGGGAVVLAARVAGGDGRLRVLPPHHRPQGGERLDARVGARMLVAVHRRRLAAPLRHRDRDDLLGERRPPGRRSRGGARAAPARPAPRARSRTRGAGSPPSPASRPAPGWSRPPAVTRERTSRSCRSRPPIFVPQRASVVKYSTWLMLSAPPAMTSSQAPVCTCIAAVSTACSPEPQRRSTCAPGTLDAEAGVERRHPADRRRLGVRVALAENDVVDGARIERGPLEHPADRRRREVGRGDVAEDAAEPPDRRPQRLADDGVAHRAPG